MYILIAILILSSMGIVIMLYRGIHYVRNFGGGETKEVNASPSNAKKLWKKIRIILVYLIHSVLIFLSKVWARISYRISQLYKKITDKIKKYFQSKNEANPKSQSILLTTVKAYKKELRKLKEKIESDKTSDNKKEVVEKVDFMQ